MNVFEFRNQLVGDYADFIKSFINITDDRIKALADRELENGLLWPDPLIQLDPAFQPGETIDELVAEEVLHPECGAIFRTRK